MTEDFDRPANPETLATLLMRFTTANGSRTVVANGLSLRDAALVADAVTESGHYAEFKETGSTLALKELVARKRKALARKSKPAIPTATITHMPRKAGGRT